MSKRNPDIRDIGLVYVISCCSLPPVVFSDPMTFDLSEEQQLLHLVFDDQSASLKERWNIFLQRKNFLRTHNNTAELILFPPTNFTLEKSGFQCSTRALKKTVRNEGLS